MERFFARLFMTAVGARLQRLQWVAFGLLCFISYMLLFLFQFFPVDATILGLTKVNALSIFAAVLSSALFLIIVALIDALKLSTHDTMKAITDNIVDQAKIMRAFSQRGNDAILDEYSGKVQAATARVWAIGVTNSRFIDQHIDSIGRLLKKRSKIDVRIAFLSPHWKIMGPDGQTFTLVQFHQQLERRSETNDDFVRDIEAKCKRITAALKDPASEKGGSVCVYLIPSVAHFSCFVIDDEVFFFPMLNRQESGQDPALLVDASGFVGKAIIQHLERLFEDEFTTRFIEKTPLT